MLIKQQEFYINGLRYTIRSATIPDAQALSDLRLQLDGETENFDREQGEAFIDTAGFEQIIRIDTESPSNICLVAVVDNRIIGFSRCEGSALKRLAHANNIKTIALQVLETNDKASRLYEKLGFTVEGILKNDKRLSDGKYYHTMIMGRWKV